MSDTPAAAKDHLIEDVFDRLHAHFKHVVILAGDG